ncbi:hypothetical protein [Azospirillum picis]|uniref:Co-chaperone DjlA N-terminal domain-containing protein n=1 Tax=Azospirillum picis TaxID=488438 RepID=A0ABU0MSU4_9PROT|nr:hypothetical protein [Azospirillum picis]MBP2302780.1 hypothetical protein [Azospirillum picis]MDQ0536558.1 hypothetical protein [Azospirillum picis]
MNRKMWPKEDPGADLLRAETDEELHDAGVRRIVTVAMAGEVSDRDERTTILAWAMCDAAGIVERRELDRLESIARRLATSQGSVSEDDKRILRTWSIEQAARSAQHFGLPSPVPPIIVGGRIFD